MQLPSARLPLLLLPPASLLLLLLLPACLLLLLSAAAILPASLLPQCQPQQLTPTSVQLPAPAVPSRAPQLGSVPARDAAAAALLMAAAAGP